LRSLEIAFLRGENQAMSSQHHRRRVPRVVPGAHPGHLAFPPDALPTALFVTRFDAGMLQERREAEIEEIAGFLDESPISWVEVVGLGSETALRAVADALSIPPLVLADIVHVPQRLRFEELEDEAWFAILREPVEGDAPVYRQVSIFVRGPVVASFHEVDTPVFDPLRARISTPSATLRRRRAEYLLHRVTDVLVDSLFPILERTVARLDQIEGDVQASPSAAPLRELYGIRRLLRGVHRVAVPMRDTVSMMAREGDSLFEASTRPLLHDVHDHAAQLAELAEQGKGVANDVGALIESSLNLRMNRSMHALTVVASIFIPLSFLAGLYGMNFDTSSPWNMPELAFRYAYPVLLGLMAALAAGMIVWMRRRGFLSDEE
jgi:magnesium transporter